MLTVGNGVMVKPDQHRVCNVGVNSKYSVYSYRAVEYGYENFEIFDAVILGKLFLLLRASEFYAGFWPLSAVDMDAASQVSPSRGQDLT